MPTVEERYDAATSYVRRATTSVELHGLGYVISPVTGLVEWYAGKTKTTEPRSELGRIEARWLRATSDSDRSVIAREAELLADRVEESLPGAPQDRVRTNLYQGEIAHGTAATSYGQEVGREVQDAWTWTKHAASAASADVAQLLRWLLLGGGAVAGWAVYRSATQRGATTTAMERDLNASLERAASGRNAGGGGYYARRLGTELYYLVLRDDGGDALWVVPLTDEARDAITEPPIASVTLPDGSDRDMYADSRRDYKRIKKLPPNVLR